MAGDSAHVVSPFGARACDVIHVGDDANARWRDARGLMKEHYVGDGGGYVPFRPDRHILGVWRDPGPDGVLAALERQRAQ